MERLVKALTDQAKFERSREEHDKASAFDVAAKALKLTLEGAEPSDALDRAVAEQDAEDFAAAVSGITT